MIRLPDISLPDQTRENLRSYQNEVDSIPDYSERVENAKRLFKNRNRSANSTFRAVRSTLDQMCQGSRRCAYCEDSYADEIEHIRPKDLYPEQVFVWKNYLYSCGPCNGPKNNHFKIFKQETGQLLDVSRRRGDPIVPPPKGNHVLIDPRKENPLDYMALDLLETFFFVAIAESDTSEYIRAEYTISILRLNDRDAMVRARRSAFDSYRARLYEYRKKKIGNADSATLGYLVKSIKTMHHQTVWADMKRQHALHDELNKLFQDIPEALEW